MSVVLISRRNVFRAVLCGVFAVTTFTATESRAATPTPGVLTLKTVDVTPEDTTYTYEYSGDPLSTFTMPLPVPADIANLRFVGINGAGWIQTSAEIVDKGDGTVEAQIKHSTGATTGSLLVTVRANERLIESEAETAYINLEDLASSPALLRRYVRVTNHTGAVIPNGTVLKFQSQTRKLVSKLVNDLKPSPNGIANPETDYAYLPVGIERRVVIENVAKKEFAPWLPVAVGDGTVEFRMAEAWSFKLNNTCTSCTANCKFIDLRENFVPFPATDRTVDFNGIEFQSAKAITENANVLWSVSTIPVTVSANATAEKWAEFRQAFTDNAERLWRAANNNQTNATFGAVPCCFHCFYRQLLTNPMLKAKSSAFKKFGQKADNVVAFLHHAKSWVNIYRCANGIGDAMIDEPVNAHTGPPTAIIMSMPAVNGQIDSLIPPPPSESPAINEEIVPPFKPVDPGDIPPPPDNNPK